MKKLLCLILSTLLLLSLCACGGEGGKDDKAEEVGTFQAGYARTDITPITQVPLGGYGQSKNRQSTNVLDKLYTTCVALQDTDGTIVLLFSMDVISSGKTPNIRRMVSEATGVPQDHIMVAATHTHSGPDQNLAGSFVGVEAAEAAIADLSPAEISATSTKTEGMNFVRHYLMNDGTYAGDNFGSTKSGYKEHAEEGDPGMQVVRFTRAAEDKEDIIMVNWQAHPCITGGLTKTDISADFIGSTRMYVEMQTKQHFIYFTGAAGNQNAKSYIAGETPTTDYNVFGRMLGDYVLNALENLTPVTVGKVRTNQQVYTGKIDHSFDHLSAEAAEVNSVYQAQGRDAGNKVAREYGISSVYHASAIINRVSMGETMDITVDTVTVGGLAFACAPYEMFACHGTYIKENSPAEMTLVLSCCNGGNGYIPSLKAYDFGCYESHTGKFARGTGDELAEKFVTMIGETLN